MENSSSPPSISLPQFECKYCNNVPFTTKSGLQRHVRKHHPKKHTKEPESRRAQCPNCRKMIWKNYILWHQNNECSKSKPSSKSTSPAISSELQPSLICALSKEHSRPDPKFTSIYERDKHKVLYHLENLFIPSYFQNGQLNLDKNQFKNICEDFLKIQVDISMKINKCSYCTSNVMFGNFLACKCHLVNCHLEELVEKLKEQQNPDLKEVKYKNIPATPEIIELDQDIKVEYEEDEKLEMILPH